ncbi:phage neck terminator protein [Komagataeibacter oboediens]
MTANDSSTGGYLVPSGYEDAGQDIDLDLVFQPAVAALTGIDPTLVRPRWQRLPPKQPEPHIDWCALSVTDIAADTNAITTFSEALSGGVERHETLTVLCSFYGPNSALRASDLRDGLMLSQNRSALLAAGIAFKRADTIRRIPELTNRRFINRADISLTFRRHSRRTYPILSVLSSSGSIMADGGGGNITTEPFDTENLQ